MGTPTDEDYDDMHHALGRPKDPLKPTYRNHYCCQANSGTARRFKQLGWWNLAGTTNSKRDAIFTVNDAGKKALAEWLKSQ